MALGTSATELGSPPERRQRNRARMVAAILEAARQVMREEGVAALNLQEVARRVGLRAPSLYEYFPSRMAMYDALFKLGVRLWAERVAEIRASEFGSPWELLRAIMETYVDFGDDQPEMYKLIHERHVPGFEPSAESLAESVRLTQLGVEALKPWMDRGDLVTELSAEEAFDLVIVVLHGLTGSHVADKPGDRSPTSRFRRLIPAAVALFEASWSPKRSTAGDRPARRAPRKSRPASTGRRSSTWE